MAADPKQVKAADEALKKLKAKMQKSVDVVKKQVDEELRKKAKRALAEAALAKSIATLRDDD